ncbi:major facilitator superfamily domain-containing protein [Halenospora varia]|nr:major facilitator superfamily domain-containing protein [Halenospora varia]
MESKQSPESRNSRTEKTPGLDYIVEGDVDGEGEAKSKMTSRTYAAFAAMCVVVLTESLDATSIAVVLPEIAQSIKSSTTATFALASSFLLASTVFQPVFASISHVFGRKPVLLVALLLFLAGAIIAALSNNISVLLGGRIIQGVGAAGTISLTVVIVTDLVSLRNRAPWYAVLNAMWAVGSVSGPVVGGAFVTTTWRWIFWINIPLVITSFTSVVFFLRLMIPEGTFGSKLRRVDFVGMLLFLISATSFLLPITLAGTVLSWSSFRILVPLIVGFAGLAVFVCHQKFIAKNPTIKLSIFANRTTVIGHCGTFIHGILLWMILYYLPLYCEGVRGYSPLMAGIAAFPETFTVAPAAIITGLAVSKSGHYLWALRMGWTLTALGMGLLCLLDQKTSIVSWIFINLVAGLGLGMLIPAGGTAIQAATPPEDAAQAISMFYLIRASGQTVGVAIGSTIFRYQMRNVLVVGETSPEATTEGLLKILRTLHRGGDEAETLIRGVVGSLRVVWAVGCGFAGCAGFACLWMKGYTLNQQRLKPESGSSSDHGKAAAPRGECKV